MFFFCFGLEFVVHLSLKAFGDNKPTADLKILLVE